MGFLCAEYDYETDIQVQREESFEDGAKYKLICQVCKKLRKGMSVADIADALEEDVNVIEPIVKAANAFAPDYDIQKVYKSLCN